MPRVIIVSGDERMFLDDSKFCESFCRNELLISSVQCFCPGGIPEGTFFKMLDNAFSKGDIGQPLLLIYNGHGEKGFWAYGGGRQFLHKSLAELVKKHKAPVLIINNSCFSFSLANVFAKERVPSDRVGIIAVCGADNISFSGILCQDIFKSWQAGAPYRMMNFDQWLLSEIDGDIEKLDSLSGALLFSFKYWRAKFIFTFSKLLNRNDSDMFKSKRWGAELDHYFDKTERFLKS